METGSEIVQGLPWRWRVQGKIFIIGGLGYMFDAWDVTLNGYLTPLLGEHFDLTVAEKGLVATANLIGMAVGAVVWGTIADRVGRKNAFSLTLLVFALFSVLAALSPTYDFFLAARFLAGVGLGGCIPVDYALVGEFTPSRQRGRVLTAMDVWWPIGGTLCGLVATALLPVHGNWRWMLTVMILPALLLFWIRRGVPESPLYLAGAGRETAARAVIDDLVARTGAESRPYAIVAPGPRAPRGVQAAFGQLARIWRYSPRITSVAWLLFVSIMLVYYVSLTWLPTILKSQGYGSYVAFSGTTTMTAVGAVGVILSAVLVEVVGRKWVIGISAPLASVVLVVFASTLKVHSAALLWIAVFGFVIQFTIPALYAYVAELYPTALRASGFGWASSMSRIASGFIPFIFGTVLWPQLGLTMTFTVAAGFVLVAVVWMAVAGPETKGRNLDADASTVPAPAPVAGSA
ncbi:MFS transporter [Actinoallomurus acanthiterrae]